MTLILVIIRRVDTADCERSSAKAVSAERERLTQQFQNVEVGSQLNWWRSTQHVVAFVLVIGCDLDER